MKPPTPRKRALMLAREADRLSRRLARLDADLADQGRPPDDEARDHILAASLHAHTIHTHLTTAANHLKKDAQ